VRKTALITGGAGFLGRHFADELESRGWDVITIDVVGTTGFIPLFGKTSRLHLVEDVRQFFRRDVAYIDAGRPLTPYDLVIHCAAKNPHRAAIDSEPMNLTYNIELDAALFNWALTARPKSLVYVSSSAIYPVGLQMRPESTLRLRETFAGPRHAQYQHTPDGPYGWTKLTGEHMAEAYRAVGGAVTIIRPFSGYGEDQSTNFPFNSLVHKVLRGDEPIEIWGNTQQSRDWIHVDDLVRGTLVLAEKGEFGPVNVCTGRGTSMTELVKIAAELEGRAVSVVGNTDRPMGVYSRIGHPGEFFKHYEPQVTLVEGVRRAVESWRRENDDG